MEELRHIRVSVKCHWSEFPPVYRIYVNSDLMTERTFSWPGYRNYIRENLVCRLEPGIHTVRIENCSGHGKFELEPESFEVDGNFERRHPNHHDPTYQQIIFIVP